MSYNYYCVLVFLLYLIFWATTTNSELKGNDDEESFCKTFPDHETGVCINLNDQLKHCPKLASYLETEREGKYWDNLRRSFCSETITSGRVCCPLEGEDGYEDDIIHDPEPNYKDHRNWNLFSLKNTGCGGLQSSAFKVFGGEDSYLGKFPWMARIGYITKENQYDFKCSGAIINKRYILTSAHCLLGLESGHQLAPVRLAENDDSINPELAYHNESVHYKDFQVDEVIIHPNYTSRKTSPHDIALIRLREEIPNITTDFYTRAVCLPFVKEYGLGDQLNEKLLVRLRNDRTNLFRPVLTGWGKTEKNNQGGSSILQFLRVPVQPNILCRIHYGKSYLPDTHICAGGERGKGSCWGDSGGPLVQNAVPNRVFARPRQYQIGIISFGKRECGKNGIPVVYTRVRNYLWWILEMVRE